MTSAGNHHGTQADLCSRSHGKYGLHLPFNPSDVLTCNDQLERGCQSGLALMADIPLAAPNGQFGQLDVNIDTITGGDGSQPLAKTEGRSCVMELRLAGRVAPRMMSSVDAKLPSGTCLVTSLVRAMSSYARPSPLLWRLRRRARLLCMRRKRSSTLVRPLPFFLPVLDLHCCSLIRACVLAYEQSLLKGLSAERWLFHMTFATEDQRVRKIVLNPNVHSPF